MMGRTTAKLGGPRTLFAGGTVAGLTDCELLLRFVNQPGDVAEAAFAALVARHGPMVLGACRRMLANPHDADDAFQATFLVLVRQAKSIQVDETLAPWLYGVCHRVASRLRAETTRRRARETAALPDLLQAPEESSSRWDVRAVIDDELSRLSEPYRASVVLCYLEGLSLEEAARQLRCPVGTIKSRLSRAREQLSRRLTRRGLALPAGTLGGVFTTEVATARALARLAEPTVAGAMKHAVSGATIVGTLSASVDGLTQGVLRTMLWTKLIKTAGFLLVLGSVGAYGLAQQSQRAETEPEAGRAPAPAGAPMSAKAVPETTVHDARFRPAQATSSALAGVNSAAELERWLDEPIKFDGIPRPLSEMVKLIQGDSGRAVVFHPKALNNQEVNAITETYLPIATLRRKSALRLILKPLGLTYDVDQGEVIVTTPPWRMVVATYYVGDLLYYRPGQEGPKMDFTPLIKLLTSSVAPGSWRVGGNPGGDENEMNQTGAIGSITPFFLNQSLIIRHTEETQEQVRLWFAQFRNPELGAAKAGLAESKTGSR